MSDQSGQVRQRCDSMWETPERGIKAPCEFIAEHHTEDGKHFCEWCYTEYLLTLRRESSNDPTP